MARERRFDSRGARNRGAKKDMLGVMLIPRRSPGGANRIGSGDLISVAFLVTGSASNVPNGVTSIL